MQTTFPWWKSNKKVANILNPNSIQFKFLQELFVRFKAPLDPHIKLKNFYNAWGLITPIDQNTHPPSPFPQHN